MRQHDGLGHETVHLNERIVSGLGLVRDLGELGAGSGKIALQQLPKNEEIAALARDEPITDRLAEIASLFGGHAQCDRVTRQVRRARLPDEDLAQPPRVAQFPGKVERLGEVRDRRIGVLGDGGIAASGERPRQQRRVIDLARDRQRTLCSPRLSSRTP